MILIKQQSFGGWPLVLVTVVITFMILKMFAYTEQGNQSLSTRPLPNTYLSTMNEDRIKVRNNRSWYEDERLVLETGDDTRQFKRRLPSCLIIGVKKSGTRALCEFLGIHPRIRTVCGEQHFFDYNWNYKKGLEFYRDRMPKSYPGDITVEKSAGYFITNGVRKRIHAYNSSIKLIVILRDPVKRMISDFWHERRQKENRDSSVTKMNFEDLAFDNSTGEVRHEYKPLIVSMYYIHIKLYLRYFPRHQIHIADGENFIINPVEEIAKVESFLGLGHFVTKNKVYFDKDKGFFCYRKGGEKTCLKKDKGHTHPPLAEKYINKLRIFFEPYNRNLFKLLGQEFDWY